MKKKYTYEFCKKYVEEFESLSSLKEKNPSILVVIRRNGWGEILDNLERKRHKKYRLDECIERVKQYEYLIDFIKENESMYNVILYNDWKHILKNLKRSGSKYKRCIYAYEFVVEDKKFVYIGLTFNLSARDIRHRSDPKSSVYIFANKNDVEIPEPVQLTEYVDRQEASKLENEYVKIYMNKKWNILNKAKPGNLGGKGAEILYNKENCISLAKSFNTIKEFAVRYSRPYQIIRENGWGEEAFRHMKKFNHKTDNTINKAVCQFDLNGQKIGEYYSISEANRQTGVKNSGISKCCTGERKTAGGFKWCFKDNISTISLD